MGRTGGEDEQLLKPAHAIESSATVGSDLSVFILKPLDDGRIVRRRRLGLRQLSLQRLAHGSLPVGASLRIGRLQALVARLPVVADEVAPCPETYPEARQPGPRAVQNRQNRGHRVAWVCGGGKGAVAGCRLATY